MITKEDFLNAEFLKQFKDSKKFTTFMEELYVRGTENLPTGKGRDAGGRDRCSSGVSEICS